MMTPQDFIGVVLGAAPKGESVVRLGSIDAAYSSGRPKILFDGETVVSGKAYPYLASYTPVAGHRVLLLRAGHAWVVVGRIL